MQTADADVEKALASRRVATARHTFNRQNTTTSSVFH
jgi:hypothetical protein